LTAAPPPELSPTTILMASTIDNLLGLRAFYKGTSLQAPVINSKLIAFHHMVVKNAETMITSFLRNGYMLSKVKEILKGQMDKVKAALLVYCKEQNIESVRTEEGLFYRTVKANDWTSDWESMRKFIVEQGVPELLHERLHQGNMKQFLEANPELLPPGLNVDSEYTITVRRK
jgi:hypothetical protein